MVETATGETVWLDVVDSMAPGYGVAAGIDAVAEMTYLWFVDLVGVAGGKGRLDGDHYGQRLRDACGSLREH